MKSTSLLVLVQHDLSVASDNDEYILLPEKNLFALGFCSTVFSCFTSYASERSWICSAAVPEVSVSLTTRWWHLLALHILTVPVLVSR